MRGPVHACNDLKKSCRELRKTITTFKHTNKIRRAPKPWFNENILELKRKTRKLKRMWRKYKQPDQYEL